MRHTGQPGARSEGVAGARWTSLTALWTVLGGGVLGLVLAQGAGCTGEEFGPGGDADPSRIVVVPATASLTVDHGKSANQAFRAYAYYHDPADGGTASTPPSGGVEVTDRVTWSLSRFGMGSFSGATFRTLVASGSKEVPANVGGTADVVATLGEVSGKAKLSVLYRRTVVGPGVPASPEKLFSGPEVPARSPAIVYPLDSAMLPPNLGSLEVQWNAGNTANSVFRLRVKGATLDLTVYTKALAYTFDNEAWTALSESGLDDQLTLIVSGTNITGGTSMGYSAPVRVSFSQGPIKGALYYWVADVQGGIWKYDFSKKQSVAAAFYTTKEAGSCVGCHVLSRRGESMGISMGDADGTVLDVKTSKRRDYMYKATLQAFGPDGKELVGVHDGTLTRRKVSDGSVVGTLPAAGLKVTHPDWSPDGKLVAYATAAAADFTRDTQVKNTSLHVVEPTASGWGSARVLRQGGNETSYYYPTFSPDSNWILYNVTKGSTYSSPGAAIHLMRADGTGSVELARINKGGPSNSWPRWSPFYSSHKGKRIYWITFSSTRNYGHRLKQTPDPAKAVPQIWMSAVDLDLAKQGKDPAHAPIWLPFQSIKEHNHVAQWTERIPE